MTSRVVVLSDLHLAVPGPLNNFHAGDALAAFVAEQARADTTLVLAGDVFDFLQIDGRPTTLDGAHMPALIQTTLDAVADTAWGRSLFRALHDLLDRGGRCVVLPGNHDPEVAHPAFAAQLLAKAELDAHHAGLRVHTDGPWRTKVGFREVVIGHGHRRDPWNDIPPEAVRDALAGTPSALPPGSRLVTEVLNVFKNARDRDGALRFPFVDLLKPEVPAVPLLLLYLDRELARTHLRAAGLLYTESLFRKLSKALGGSATLAGGATAAEPTADDDLALALARTYTDAQRRNPGRCIDELAEWLNGEGGTSVREGTLAAHGGMRARMLRAFLWLASDGGRFFKREHASKEDQRVITEHLPADAPPRVVIAGHTHAAREVWLRAEHAYFNTGTWTDLMAFPGEITDDALKGWIDALERRDVPRVRRLTWAEVTNDTAALREHTA